MKWRSVKLNGKVVSKCSAKGKLWHKYNNRSKELRGKGLREYKCNQCPGVTLHNHRSDVNILLDLCNLVTNVNPSKHVTKIWVANKAEIIESFILQVTVIDSLEDEIQRICDRAKLHKVQVSLFAVVVGDDPQHIVDAYTYIDGIQYRAVSPLHAVDQCMKAVHALQAEYQEQSKDIWLLFQHIVYGIKCEWDATSPVVQELERRLALLI